MLSFIKHIVLMSQIAFLLHHCKRCTSILLECKQNVFKSNKIKYIGKILCDVLRFTFWYTSEIYWGEVLAVSGVSFSFLVFNFYLVFGPFVLNIVIYRIELGEKYTSLYVQKYFSELVFQGLTYKFKNKTNRRTQLYFHIVI